MKHVMKKFMKKVMKKEMAGCKGCKGIPITGYILLASLFLGMADFSGVYATTSVPAESAQIWDFDKEQAGNLPPDFRVGILVDGRPAGEWQVIDMQQTLALLPDLDRRDRQRIQKVLQNLKPPSPPHVLAQFKNRGFNQDYNVVLLRETTAIDVELEVSFLPIAGKADMGGGPIWRAQDYQNYYLTRANPLEQNIRLYRVVNGVRYQLANFDHIISVDTWHTFRVLARGHHIQIIFDGQKVLDIQDETFQSGQIGLWTKADAVTFFDDFRLSVLD